MADDARDEGPLPFLTRRRFLKLALGGGGLLVGGGVSGLLWLRGWAPDVPGLRTLSDFQYRTVAALARTQFPGPDQGGLFAVGADDLDLARLFDGWLADESAEVQEQLGLALALVEFGPTLFEGRLTTFPRLDAEARRDHWERVWVGADDLTRRKVRLALQKFLCLVYYDQEAVWPAIGYPGPGRQG